MDPGIKALLGREERVNSNVTALNEGDPKKGT